MGAFCGLIAGVLLIAFGGRIRDKCRQGRDTEEMGSNLIVEDMGSELAQLALRFRPQEPKCIGRNTSIIVDVDSQLAFTEDTAGEALATVDFTGPQTARSEKRCHLV